MRLVSPTGPVYQAGTLSGNPVAISAGIATLKELQKSGFYENLNLMSRRLESGISERATENGVDLIINRVGSMLGFFFSKERVMDYLSAKKSNTSLYTKYFWTMLGNGVYLPPSPFETHFVSSAHTVSDVETTVEAAANAFQSISIVSKAQ
jgi:glutamate-1-semialdehyde 2,1-aminomutase